jgi:predicted DNA-binding WGR domain protein
MTAVTLHRSDSTKNLHRYYQLDVQPDLFGAWCFIRDWGCIGKRGGQSRTVPYPTTATEAQAALERQRRKKSDEGIAMISS